MKANPCIQSIRLFIFVVPYQLPNCDFRFASFCLCRMFFQVKNGILMRSPRPKRGGKLQPGPPSKDGWFLLRDVFCKHSLDSLRKNLIS